MNNKIMITCKEATDFISQKEEGRLSFKEKIKLAFHLYICELCKLFYKQNMFIVNNIKNISIEESLTEEEQTKLSIKIISNTQ